MQERQLTPLIHVPRCLSPQACASLACHPYVVLKVRLQVAGKHAHANKARADGAGTGTGTGGPAQPRSTMDCVRDILARPQPPAP